MSKVVPTVDAVAIYADPISRGTVNFPDTTTAALPSQIAIPHFENEEGAREFLSMHRFPLGLQNSFIESLSRLPMRYIIIDDSGSMSGNDGKRIVRKSGGGPTPEQKLMGCSRWDELTEGLKFHIDFARHASAPTEFRLLNGAAPIKIGYNDAEEEGRYSTLKALMDGSPNGGTPLCRHIREIIAEVREIESELRRTGQHACLIITTDGMPSDGDVAEALRPLKDLPVWVLLRLCTDNEGVVSYWNAIDEQLELSMDVIDDLSGEAREVNRYNKWLTYGEPIQRLREFGISVKELDLLDERKLSADEMRKVCKAIFGGKLDDYPHPEMDFGDLWSILEEKNRAAGLVWNPSTQKYQNWVEKRPLEAAYGKKSGCVIC
eukprot:CAMPEP_0174987736 /NCGR_PEP_ID=MMETSP0004_2-20121128/19719_1 /TAXON_ID=420556 /ORGANISM="Ochromonas sp., Strain CCMP1393" /LENGTH=376 /DNA_ID=CAMNT_0016240841 /DNA_START=180 /DNA_END=1310 /DNA_ORIENTATION=-